MQIRPCYRSRVHNLSYNPSNIRLLDFHMKPLDYETFSVVPNLYDNCETLKIVF